MLHGDIATPLRKLTPEVLRTFIERIIIHERTAKHSKSASQQIDIYFRYIGKLMPKKSLETQNGIGRTAETVRPTYREHLYAVNILMRNCVMPASLFFDFKCGGFKAVETALKRYLVFANICLAAEAFDFRIFTVKDYFGI